MNAESDERDGAAAPADPAPATGDVAGGVTGDVTPDVTKEDPELGSRAPGFIKASRALHLSWQVGVFLVGLAVVVAGIIMLPLPGPGWLVIFGGMAIWATEFVWAQLVLRWTRRKVTEAAKRALDPKVRRRNIALTVVGLVIVAVLVGIYVWKFGIVMPWKIHE
ncbi:uncharacterized protein (TIGR02611 family) [Streptomyces sp. 840.1]|uniref:TIGR02611 family protein n=1 Tax=Streptomyces sp. 840.1 TaxID=2485152 RepID=UPI000F48F982|nr:TIGR02611 family protein [Streptomyces sp. 840.1]ROQ62842.1 uncharacterized protein (TIGR02611 family) [Streptomyces sp. 840.1]